MTPQCPGSSLIAEWRVFSKPFAPKFTRFCSSQQTLPPSEGGKASHQAPDQIFI